MKKIEFFVIRSFFTLTNSVDPDDRSMQHFILFLAVCKSTCLGVCHIQRVKSVILKYSIPLIFFIFKHFYPILIHFFECSVFTLHACLLFFFK